MVYLIHIYPRNNNSVKNYIRIQKISNYSKICKTQYKILLPIYGKIYKKYGNFSLYQILCVIKIVILESEQDLNYIEW